MGRGRDGVARRPGVRSRRKSLFLSTSKLSNLLIVHLKEAVWPVRKEVPFCSSLLVDTLTLPTPPSAHKASAAAAAAGAAVELQVEA